MLTASSASAASSTGRRPRKSEMPPTVTSATSSAIA